MPLIMNFLDFDNTDVGAEAMLGRMQQQKIENLPASITILQMAYPWPPPLLQVYHDIYVQIQNA